MGGALGIPYARAERWRPPEPVDDAEPLGSFGPAAPQRTEGPLLDLVPGMKPGAQDEAGCLTLNVFAPPGAEGLPVLVWIHGGAYVIGASSLPVYDPARLVEQGVVVVSLNYRLGALANLWVDGSTNRGLLDQVAALRWVQRNIERHGGDPGNVTVFGESAGAGSILHLLGAPAATGLFRRAILQSPGAEVVHEAQSRALAEAFRAPLDAPVDQLLAAELAAEQEVAHLFGAMPWQPVVDGEVLPVEPRKRLAAGVDVLVGTTSAELSLFTGAIPPELAPKVLQHLWTPVLGHTPSLERCQRLVSAYGGDVTQVLSDAAMGVPAVELADLLSVRGRTFAYRFDWEPASFHAADLPFTFGTFDADGWGDFVHADDDARRLSDEMIRAWTSFARTGDPGWPAYDADARQTMVLGRTSAVVEHPLAALLPRFEEFA